MKRSVTIIGAGKVGSALCKSLYNSDYQIDSVISEGKDSADKLAAELGLLSLVDSSKKIKSEIVIIAVPDGKIKDVVLSLNVSDHSLVVHTAGGVSLNVFSDLKCRVKGILYPMQTFSIGRETSMDEVPFLIEADSADGLSEIERIALDLSPNVFRVDSEKRKVLHLAAVIVSNFVNHMYCVANEVLDNYDISSDLLDALKRETVEKAIQLGPENSRTGPAVRNDQLTIEKQRDLLSFSPEIQDLYLTITESIKLRNRSTTNE